MNIYKIICAFLLFSITGGNTYGFISKQNVKANGAAGNGTGDDAAAIIKTINEADTTIIPKGVYIISKKLSFKGLTNKVIIATGAIIKNNDSTSGTLQFEESSNIIINGGTWDKG